MAKKKSSKKAKMRCTEEDVYKALQESEEKFRLIVEKSQDAIMLTLPDTTISYMSPACKQVLGYDPKDLVGTAPNIFHPEDRKKVLKALSGAVRGKPGTDFEYRIITKDGETKLISHSWAPIKAGGKVKLVVSTVRDVTKQREYQMAVNESEEKYRALFENSNDAIFIHDLDGKILDVNKKALEMFGYGRKKMLSMKIPQLHPRSALPASKKAFREVRKEGFVSFGIEFKKKNGKTFPAEVSSALFEVGDKKVVQGIVRDVSERKEAEEQLKHERDRANKYLNLAADIVVEIGKDQRVRLINERGCRVLGYQPKDIIGKNWFNSFLPRRIRKEVKSVFMKVIRGKLKPVEMYENPVLTKSGERMISWRNTFLKDGKGRITSALSSGRDVTDAKKAEQERLELFKRKEMDRMKDEFFSMTTHELKTPLTPIRLEADMWLNGVYGELTIDQTESMERIERNSLRLITLIEDITTISKMDQNRFRYTLGKNDMRQIIADLGSDMKALVEKKGLYLKAHLGSEPLVVNGDRERLVQVLVNLVDNALKATRRGGITIIAKAEGKNAVISVKDTGVGIPKSEQKRIFEKFYRVVRPRYERYEGVGLGLPIAKRIIEDHRGEIGCSSRPGKGSNFYFTIPLIK